MTPRLQFPMTGGPIRLRAGEEEAVLERDGERAGTVWVSVDGARVTIAGLCVDADKRGHGTGSAAARLLIRQAARAGFTMVRAWAPADRGLAVYFWFRMGLRPAPGESAEGGIWLSRELTPFDAVRAAGADEA